MRRPQEHCAAGIFVAEGEKVVRRLLESRLSVVSLLMPEKWLDIYRPLLESRPDERIDVYIAPRAVIEELAGITFFQGVLAIGGIPAPEPLESLLRAASPLLAAVEGVTNAQNLGALVRNCAAFGADGIVVDDTSCSPYLRAAVRTSMAAVFTLPIHHTRDLAGTLRELRVRGVRCVAAHPHAEGKTLYETSLDGPCCILFGSEGHGISEPVLSACDECTGIPMAAGVDSL